MNKVMLIGHLGKDPELRYTQNGRPVARLSVATNERWTKADSTQEERTDWHTVDAWGRTAENCAQYLAKGRQVFIEGRIQYDAVPQEDGSTKYYTKIVAQQVEFLGGNGQRQPVGEANETPIVEEIPF